MDSIDTETVQQNQYIEAGVKIGTSGNTGSCSEGAHLHFQVERNEVPVDPYGWTGTGTDPYTRERSVILWE